MRKLSVLKIGLSALGLLFTMAASAAPATFNFSTLVNVNNPNSNLPNLGGTPAIGSSYNGEFTIDTSIVSGVGNNCVGISHCWSDSATSWNWDGIQIELGSPDVFVPADFRVIFDIVDSVAGSGADMLTVSLEGYYFQDAELYFTDSSGSAFESTPIGQLLPSFSSFDSATYDYFIANCFGGALGCFARNWNSGDLISFSNSSISTIPLPAATYLFGSALASLLMAKRNRRKKT